MADVNKWLWIGLHDKTTEGDFEWEDGTSVSILCLSLFYPLSRVLNICRHTQLVMNALLFLPVRLVVTN